MEQYERDAREAVAKALEAEGWPNTAALFRRGQEAMNVAIRALLPLLATSDLERRALEACEKFAQATFEIPLASWGCEVRAVGRESLAAKKPKGPWRVVGHSALHSDGRAAVFYDARGNADPAACAEWVREQNEKAAR